MIHLHRLILVLHPNRRLEVFRADGTPIDRGLPTSEWMQAPPEDPERIGGQWCGDRLSIPDCFDALGLGWTRPSRGKPDDTAQPEPAVATA